MMKNALGNRLYSGKMTDEGVGQNIWRNKTKIPNHKTAIFTCTFYQLHTNYSNITQIQMHMTQSDWILTGHKCECVFLVLISVRATPLREGRSALQTWQERSCGQWTAEETLSYSTNTTSDTLTSYTTFVRSVTAGNYISNGSGLRVVWL